MYQYGDERSSLYPGTLRGYRVWELSKGPIMRRPILKPIVIRGRAWRPQLNRAKCKIGWTDKLSRYGMGLHSFDPKCTCGLYAVHDPLDAPYVSGLKLGIFGSIKASGVVVIGGRGFRAEKAQIEALCCLSFLGEHNEQAERVARRYAVPLYSNPRELIDNFPPNEFHSSIKWTYPYRQ